MVQLIQNGRERLLPWRRKLGTAIAAMLLVTVAYYVVFSANGLLVYRQKRLESTELDRQIKALQQQNNGMEQEIRSLKTDPKAIEKEAREHMGYARPGEIVFTLPKAPAAPIHDNKDKK